MKTKTQQTISSQQLCDLIGIKERRLRQLVEEGKIPPPENGGYPLVATLKAAFQFYREASDARERNFKQRERLAEMRAKKLEWDVAREQGKYLLKEDVHRTLHWRNCELQAILSRFFDYEIPDRFDGEMRKEVAAKCERVEDEMIAEIMKPTKWAGKPDLGIPGYDFTNSTQKQEKP